MSVYHAAFRAMREVGRGLTSLVAPWRCLACGGTEHEPEPEPEHAWESLVCGACRVRVERIGAACRACGRSRGPHAGDSARCGRCRSRPKGGVRRTVALLRYRGPGRTLVRRLKYGGAIEAGESLGRALGERVRHVHGEPPAGLWVVPIPLHPWRRLTRGFNQAELIAAGVAAALGRPLVPALRRRRATRALYGFRHEAREEVLAGAFGLCEPIGARGRPIVLVDDIRTSGATLRAAAQALRRGGAGPVDAAVVAR